MHTPLLRSVLYTSFALTFFACAARPQRQQTTAPTSASTPDAAAPDVAVARAFQFPSRGCDPTLSPAETSSNEDGPLAQLPSESNTNTTVFADGSFRIALPSEWFASRIDRDGLRAWRIRTGRDEDVLTLYLGENPPFRNRPTEAFRFSVGTIPIRGWLHAERQRAQLEALALLPCSSPRFAHITVETNNALTIVRAVAALRTLQVTTPAQAVPEAHDLTLTEQQHNNDLQRLTQNDPVGRTLLQRALRAGALQARYPLDTEHPLADQVLRATLNDRLGGVPTQLWVRIPVSLGRVTATSTWSSVFDGSLARVFSSIASEQCTAPSAVVSGDGLGFVCGDDREYRFVLGANPPANALVQAAETLRALRTTLQRWRASPVLAGGFPSSLCDGNVTLYPANRPGIVYLRSTRCAALIDTQNTQVLALTVEGDCNEALTAPWSTLLRNTTRIEEARGNPAANAQTPGATCRYALGWKPRAGWLLAAGDGGTVSGPLQRGQRTEVDRRAVHTAAGFLHDLLAFADDPQETFPPNVRPALVRLLGLDRPGTSTFTQTFSWFRTRGGPSGPAVAAPLDAQWIDNDRISVTFLPVRIELTRESGAWIVTGVYGIPAPLEAP